MGLPADLAQNRSCFGGRIGSFSDGAAYHNVARARGNGLSRSDDADLIGCAASCGADPWGHNGEVGPQFRAQSRGFAGGRDNALTTTGQRHAG